MAAGFVAALACLVATAVVTVTLEATRDAQAQLTARASATLVVVEELEVAVNLMVTATEAAVHGIHALDALATLQGRGRIEALLAELDPLVADEPALRDLYQQLVPMVRELQRAADQAASALQAGRLDEAGRVASVLEPTALARAGSVLEEMEVAEGQVLRRREASWRRTALAGVVVFSVATLALLVLIFAAARTVREEIRGRERLAGELEAQVELQQQLMAIVGHDLRNPLASMKSGAALLLRTGVLTDDQREDAGRILSNARRMERLIRDLLDFSRSNAGVELPVHLLETDLVELSRRVVSDLGRDAEGRVSVERRGDVGGRWDPERLEQVVANLVSNAIKYGPPHRPVRVLVDGTGDRVRLAVTDEGGGLAQADLEGLFQPFRRRQVPGSEHGESVGLGLYVVRRIAEAHGGQVSIDSTPGRGTTFTVDLPRGRGPRAGPPAADG